MPAMTASTLRNLPPRCTGEIARKSFAIGLLLALTWLPTPSSALEPSTDHDVVIVGAGPSGLYAAYTLKNLGYDVLVVEASDRHGGRLYPDTLGDSKIERGAEELYPNSGQNKNFVFNDVLAQYGASAQNAAYTGQTLYEIPGGSTCRTGCGSDPDIYDYWDFASGLSPRYER